MKMVVYLVSKKLPIKQKNMIIEVVSSQREIKITFKTK